MSFFYGLVEGLATSANEALQNDIKRINTRVDSIAERQLEKALKEQEKRAEEVAKVEAALKEGYALFGGDENPAQAKQYAAGLLKEMGDIDAYKERIAELRTAKNDLGQDLNQFFSRASEDAPTGSFTDYANAFLGAPKTFAGDYRVPDGMRGERPAGGLVSKVVGKPIDVVQMGLTRAKEDITAAIGDTKFESIPLPTVTFHAEKFKMSGMKASERIEYINNKLANPDNTDERNTELQGMLTNALKAAEATGDINTKIDAKKQMLSRTTSEEEKKALTNEISELTYQSEVTEAKASGSAVAEIDAEIKRAQFLRDMDRVKELVKQKKELTGDEPSFKEITTELETDLMNGLANGSITEGSEAHKSAMSEIEKRRDIEQNVTGASDMKPSELRGAQSYFNTELRNETQARLGALGQSYITILEAIESGTQNVVDLEGTELETYQKGQAIEAEVKGSLVSSMTSTYSEEEWPELYAHLRMKGLLPSDRQTTGDVIETGSGDQPVSTTTDVTTTGDQTAKAIPTQPKPEKPAAAVTEDTKINLDAIRAIVKEDVIGANEIVKDSDSPQDAYDTAISLYPENKQFATTVEFIASKDNTGIEGLEKEIAKMALQGLDANQITQQLKQVKYAGDTSMDVASISSTVARVLAELSPEARQERIESQKRANEAKEARLSLANQRRQSLQLPTGLMSKQ